MHAKEEFGVKFEKLFRYRKGYCFKVMRNSTEIARIYRKMKGIVAF